MSPEDERALVTESLGIYERLDLWREDPSGFEESPISESRLEAWAKLHGDRFDERLRLDGLDRESAKRMLGRVTRTPRPTWISVVEEVLRDPRTAVGPEMLGDPSTPFREYWRPWAQAAMDRANSLGALWDQLDESIRAQLVRSLVLDLARCGTQVLMHAFNLYRFSRLDPNAWFLASVGLGGSNELYSAFIDRVTGPSAERFLREHPCFARLSATRVELWLTQISELLSRFDSDRSEIGSLFGVAAPRISSIETELSDSHAGRRVMICELRSDDSTAEDSCAATRVVYKPREVTSERAWSALVNWTNAHSGTTLRALRVLEREGYGWVEAAVPASIEDPGRVDEYFRRCGSLLALARMLRGSDCHRENMIASGDQPLLIDLEVLVTPQPQGSSPSDPFEARLRRSVLSTGMLPEWTRDPEGKAVDISGMGARAEESPTRAYGIVRPNSDFMTFDMSGTLDPLGGSNEPRTTGGSIGVDPHRDQVVEGFKQVHACCRREKETLARRSGVLQPFASTSSRIVLRPTNAYALLLRQSRSAELMRDAVSRSIALDRMASPWIESPRFWAVHRHELEALLRGDVPLFVARTDSPALFAIEVDGPELVVEAAFEPRAFHAMLDEIRALDQEDESFQVRLIELSFLAKSVVEPLERHARMGQVPIEDPVESVSPASSVVIDERASEVTPRPDELALRARERVILAALRVAREDFGTSDGSRHRVGLIIDELTGRPRVAPIGWSLYSGQTGVSLFLAACAADAQLDELRASSLSGLRALRAALRVDPSALVARNPLGGFEGIGGLIYGLAVMGRLLGESGLVDDAVHLARSIRPSRIEAEPHHDVLMGTAGLILALVALNSLTGGERDLIERCARRLASAKQVREIGVSWISGDSLGLTGLSHGNAGIALALLEAWRATGDDELRATARDALAFERRHRLLEVGNWRDLRSEGDGTMTTWCHGAPGIALARSRMLMIEEDVELRRDLEMAIETTRRARPRAAHLCCGSSGLAEILFQLGSDLGDEALREAARSRVFEQTQALLGSPSQNVSLMRGTAGMAYGTLRQVSRISLPSLLDLRPAR